MTGDNPRQKLLDAAIDYVAANGITDLSLRHLATELGTSHRMLSHHFGSKEGLWVAIVREVEREQLAALEDLTPDDDASLDDAMRAWWRHISDPSLWPNERLFFEVYAQALHDRPPAKAIVDSVVDPWIAAIVHLGERAGSPPEAARAFARLGIA